MLTGRFQLAAPTAKHPSKTAVVLGFGTRARRARAMPRRGRPGRPGCPRTTRPPRSAIATRPRWARSTCSPPGVDRPVAGLGGDDQGPDADDPALTLDVWRERIRRHPGRAQEPPAQPGVRRRHRQRLQRRDPPRGPAPAVPQAVEPRVRGGRRAVRGDADDPRDARSTSCASGSRRRSRSRSATSSRSTTRAASRVRGAGRRSPRSARAASSRRTAGAASADAAPADSADARRPASGQLAGPGRRAASTDR